MREIKRRYLIILKAKLMRLEQIGKKATHQDIINKYHLELKKILKKFTIFSAKSIFFQFFKKPNLHTF